MGIFQVAIALGILAFFAHVIKGLTGFGPAIVFVSIGSLIYNPVEVIVLAALLDIIGGCYLSILNPHFFKNKEFWVPIGGGVNFNGDRFTVILTVRVLYAT